MSKDDCSGIGYTRVFIVKGNVSIILSPSSSSISRERGFIGQK